MAIFLYSGNPGSGKSLKLVETIDLALLEGRRVFVHGLRGLVKERPDGTPFNWEVLEDPNKWMECPTGSLVIIDEVQGVWPAGARETPWPVKAFSKHRSDYGLDIVIASQYPNMIIAWLRELVDRHDHHVRRMGFQASKIFRWNEGQDDVKSNAVRQRAMEVFTWLFPKKYYGWYTSAPAHTVKAQVPKRFYFLGLAMVCVVALAGFAYYELHKMATVTAKESLGTGVAKVLAEAKPTGAFDDQSAHGKHVLSTAEYLAMYKPRVPSEPWSAPIYDDRKPANPPRLFCMSSGSQCQCATEQGTQYELDNRTCRYLSRWGQYEPLKPEPRQSMVLGGDRRQVVSTAPQVEQAHGPGLVTPVAADAAPRIGGDYTGIPGG
jgi:zona occludens toxin